MVADASIYGLIKEPKPIDGPVDQYGKLLNLKNLMTQNRVHELQGQQLEQNVAEDEAFRKGLASLAPGETLESATPRLMTVAPLKTLDLQNKLLNQKKLTGEVAKQDLEAQALKAKDARDTLAGVTDQPSYDAWRQYAKQKGYQVGVQAPDVFDPKWQQQHVMTADKFIEARNHELTRAETERANKAKELHASLSLDETKRHHAAIEGDPETVESVAQGIAKGDLAPLGGFALSRPMGQQIMARVGVINPQFDPTAFNTRQKIENAFANGPEARSTRSFSVGISHLGTLEELTDALHNGNTQLVNKAANAVTKQIGGTAPVNFEAAKKIVADEIVKAIVGSGGGVADREEAAKTISAANSPEQLKGVINTYKALMRGQLEGLRRQYQAGGGRKDFDREFLSEEARAVAHGGKPAILSEADRIIGGKP